MNDNVFREYCESRSISIGASKMFRTTIIKSMDYQLFEIGTVIDDLRKAFSMTINEAVKKLKQACKIIVRKDNK